MQHNVKAIYINLEKRTDKREFMENELTQHGLKFERYNALECPDFGCYGCAMSHLGALKHARYNGYKSVMILEDDFFFSVTKDKLEEQMEYLFSVKPDFDVCMLSYYLIGFDDKEDDLLYRIKEAQSGAGYIVNHHYYDKLISLFENANQLLQETRQTWIYTNDQIWKQFQLTDKWYCFKERTGHQLPGFSDISQCHKAHDDW